MELGQAWEPYLGVKWKACQWSQSWVHSDPIVGGRGARIQTQQQKRARRWLWWEGATLPTFRLILIHSFLIAKTLEFAFSLPTTLLGQWSSREGRPKLGRLFHNNVSIWWHPVKETLAGCSIQFITYIQCRNSACDLHVSFAQVTPSKNPNGDFPSGPVVKTPCFQCRQHKFDAWSGTQIPHALGYGQKNILINMKSYVKLLKTVKHYRI